MTAGEDQDPKSAPGPSPKAQGERSVFRRMAKNAGWVFGSRGFNSVISVVYLAVVARALGPAAFGAFALILTYAQMVANFIQFQSWKGVIRYGSLHVADQRPDRLERLFGFSATLDFASAIGGAFIAVVCVPLAGPLLHWASDDQTVAAIFAGVLLLTTGATPTGMLRLFDRFDLVAYSEAVGPLVRLAGSLIAWAMGGGVTAFLAVAAIAGVAQCLTQWVAALRINRSRLVFGPRAFKAALKENERIWPFMLQTNISNSVTMFWTDLGTLAVGAVVGPAEAGGFRLARRISKGFLRPIQPMILAIYPELTRLVAEDDHAQLRTVVLRVTAVGMVIAAAIAIVMSFGSETILRIIAGEKFEFAAPLLALLSVATAINLAGITFEPLQNAHGRSWNVLRAKLIGAGVYGVALFVLLPRLGGEGAAIAAIICAIVIFVQLAVLTVNVLKKPDSPSTPAVGEPL